MIRKISFVLFLILSFAVHSKTLLVLGDSLSAGYNMSIEQSWPSLLPNVISQEHNQTIEVINGSVSGDTTGNGLAKLPALIEQHTPDYVLVELGANDGLRGFKPNLVKDNLNEIISLSQSSGAKVFLMQIRIPPNYGKRYTQLFENIYPDLAHSNQVTLVPFFLEHVIQRADWMMDDGLHPKAQAQPWIAEFVANQLQPHLD
ncbi:arylesterase [Vibrio sp. ZSDZ34]|uniref:Arylesterase n=1 Tax=Vibrio gelatinilyticus TaxID=2893468 RepID=A0A9X2AZ39_9VIBR|nr:arylesterase [Vibrio gelatinilyticus]MCJ2377143.1 arylesterase [Vibrio gelatinilyticus]